MQESEVRELITGHTKWSHMNCRLLVIKYTSHLTVGLGAEKGKEQREGQKESDLSTYMLFCNEAKRFDRFIWSWPNISVPDIAEAFQSERVSGFS